MAPGDWSNRNDDAYLSPTFTGASQIQELRRKILLLERALEHFLTVEEIQRVYHAGDHFALTCIVEQSKKRITSAEMRILEDELKREREKKRVSEAIVWSNDPRLSMPASTLRTEKPAPPKPDDYSKVRTLFRKRLREEK